MKLRLLILLSLVCFSFTKEGDEIAVINALLQRTERQLSSQKNLKDLMTALNNQEKNFLKAMNQKPI